MATVSFNTYDQYNGGWMGSKTFGTGYCYVARVGYSTGINNLISINVSGASSSSPITSITVSLAICPSGGSGSSSGNSTTITGYLYTSYSSSLKPSNANVPSGSAGYGTSRTITATSSGTKATFTISGLNITSNNQIYLKIYCSSSTLKQIYTPSSLNSITCTTGSSSGGGTTTYTYDCYNMTNSTWIDSATYETKTTAASITRPNITGYTYAGYSVGSSWSASGVQYTGTTCTQHSASKPIIIFYYTPSSSGGGDTTDLWYATTTYHNKLSSYTSGGSTNFAFNLNAAQIGYCKFTPTASGTITVQSASNNDMYGYLVSEGAVFDETASGVGQLFSNYLKRDDDSQGNGQFKIIYNVTANDSYRIYFCAYSKTSTSSGSIYFTFEATPTITSWQTPVRMSRIGATTTTYSTTSTVNKYNAGYVQYTTPTYAGKVVFETTSGSTSPDYYSHLSTSILSAGSGTSRSSAVTGAIKSDDDGAQGSNNYDTLISYECNASTTYYWYVNAAWANSGTYSIPWRLNYYRKYTITYNANNGTGAPSSQSFYTDNLTVSIPSTIPTRPNYTFLGWSTNASATSATYAANSSATLSAQDYTLYAVWEASTYSITINYNAHGGTGAPSASTGSGNVGSNINIQISSIKPTRDRYIFKGWADGNSTTVSYQPGQIYSFSSNKTLYAVWENKFGADNVYYGVNGEWKLCEVYYGLNDEWVPLKTYYGHSGTWKNNI